MRQKFGKGIGIKETSAYKGLLKEKKPKKKPTVQAESLRLKMKDIIDEALKESGNPVSFYLCLFIHSCISSSRQLFYKTFCKSNCAYIFHFNETTESKKLDDVTK